MKEPWKGYVEPFKIWGNLYFVGTEPASTHIIDTGDGLIMLDTGYQQSLYLVIHNMHLLGFNPMDIKYIVLTHGHIDHLGGARALKELTGAKTVLGRPDEDYANGKLDLTYAKELDMEYNEAFQPDILIDDGDKICLGNTEITAVATPGHTPGAMSYFFDVTDGIETFRVGMPGGLGVNSVNKEFLESYGLPLSLQQDYLDSMDRLKDEKVDIFIGNHVWNNDTPSKYEKLKNGDKYAFVSPDDWKECMLNCKEKLQEMINNQQ